MPTRSRRGNADHDNVSKLSQLHYKEINSRIDGEVSMFKSLLIEFEERLEARYDEYIKECKSLLTDFEHKLFSDINKKVIDMNIELNTLKSELHTMTERARHLETSAANTQSIQKELQILKNKVNQHENKSISCDLRLNEIPFSADEDLYRIFENICKTINTSIPAVKTIYRLQNHNNKHKVNSRDAVIIVRMWSPYDKNHFLKTFANYRKINKGFFFRLRHIGINSENKFFVNENLSSTNFKLLRAATRLKKDNYIHSAFTLRGLVYIKKTQSDQAILVDDLDHLNCLFRVSTGSPSEVGEHQTNISVS